MRIAVTLALLVLNLLALSAPATIPEDVRQNMRQRIAVGECPGIIVGIATPEGAVFESEGRVGKDDEAGRIGPDTVFEIGSITKTFTTLIYQIAVDGGLVRPGDKLASFLPRVANLPGPVGAMTLHQLATHRSGLPRMPDNFKPADPRNPYADYSVDRLYAWLRTVKPGAADRFEYSNAGMGLLGHALALKTQSSFEALVSGWILSPLGLADTCVDLNPDQRRRAATPHADGRPIPMWDIPTLAGAGALRSTARDMLRWTSMQCGLIDCQHSAAMKKCQQPQGRTEREGGKVALAWMITPAKSGALIWHNGGTGGTRSWIGFNRKTRTAVVVLANSSEIIDDIGFHLLSPDMPLRVPEKERPISAAALKQCEGCYDLGTTTLFVKADGARLSVQLTGQPATPAFARSDTEFFLRAVDARLSFEPGNGGPMKSVTLHQNGRDQKATRK